VRTGFGIGALLVAMFLAAAPAAADSTRFVTVTERGSSGARVEYFGDERGNQVEIALARDDVLNPDSPSPERIIGFLVTGAPLAAGCEPTGSELEQVCRVPAGVGLLAPRLYGRAGDDGLLIDVPRRGAVAFGGPGSDTLYGPTTRTSERQIPAELRGGPGSDTLEGGGLLDGGPGNDDASFTAIPSRVLGGPGDDVLWGSDGADVIRAGPGRDLVLGWSGNDVLRTRDGETDSVVCDAGRDTLIADGRDESDVSLSDGPLTDCERIHRRGEPLLGPFFTQAWEGESYVSVVFACPPDGPRQCGGTLALRRSGRLIARRPLRERAGNWGLVELPLGRRRIRRLLDKDVRLTIRWRDRSGRFRSVAKTDKIERLGQPDDN
jgi:hypothetical protein